MALLLVQDLVCSYTGNLEDKVLEIKQLTIDQGEIVFLLGASGSGKSTLLETLGLMNNTLCQGDIILDRGDRKFSFSELWKEDGRNTLTTVRRNNLSFIFQNTNLMENFTAYENICLSSMIKDGRDQQTAMQGAESLMSQIGLPKSEVGISTLSVNLSGGQRQRVSFARALNNDFSLLLCDEPTGNLDETNAGELLRIIRENISGTRSAIIVSHDIDLALQFADKIVVINKDPFRGFGEVLQENIYKRDYWSSRSVAELQEFRDRIIYFFSKTRESTISKQTESRPLWHKNYKSLFYNKESKVLFGRKNINLLLVMAITMLTLLAAGFANGSLSYLQKKYNDPFINWLTIHLPTFRNGGKEIDYYLRKLQEETQKGRFLIKQTDTYKDFWLRLFNRDSRDNTWFKGRTIAYDDRLLEDILSIDNKISGALFKDKIDISIIITEKILHKLNYTVNDRFIYINNDDVNPVRKEDSLNKIPIPIRAVVKNIPGKIDFIVTDNFYLAFKNIENPVFSFNGDQAGRITLLIGSDRKKAELIRKDIEELLKKENINGFMAELDTCSQVNNDKLWTVSMVYNEVPENSLVSESDYLKIMNLASVRKNSEIKRLLYYGNPSLSTLPSFDNYLSINLDEGGLDQVDSISQFIYREFNQDLKGDQMGLIQIDSGMIKEKKNFNYLGKITFFVAAMLIIFAVMAISLFVSNLLKSHLNRVKMNIGTYKAFGLSDGESTRIYLQIMMRFILFSITGAFLLACGIGYISEYYISHQLKMEENIEYFRIFDWNTLILITLIIGISLAVSYYNIHKILSKTPGDLIYNR